MALPLKNRIKTKSDIDGLFKSKKSIRGNFVVVKWLDNKRDFNRFFISVPNKIASKSYQRNRLKRVMSSILTEFNREYEQGRDFAVLIYKKGQEIEIKDDLKQSLNRLK